MTKRARPLPANDAGPAIRLRVDVHDVVAEAIAALGRERELYTRDGYLVRVVELEGDRDGRLAWAPGSPQVRPVSAPTLTEYLTRSTRWERYDARADDWVPAIPTRLIVDAVLARGTYPGLRELMGVCEAPTLRPDGTLLELPGYDAETGYVYAPTARYLPVPRLPTRDDARRALAELREVFRDFPYASDAARDVPLAAILTLIARPAIRGAVPAFLFDATTPGSGKSLQTDAVALVATGRSAARMTWPVEDEELEKILGGYARRGAGLIVFDNVASVFRGAALDKVLTTPDRVELRVLGSSETPSFPWRAVILASGNNLDVRGDTARRVLLSRLEPDVERPQDRTGFAHPDLLGWVRAERLRLVRAALVVLRAYVVATDVDREPQRWGTFEAWSELVPPALVYAGGADVLAARLDVGSTQDPTLAAVDIVLRGLARLTVPQTARDLVALLYPTGGRRDAAPDGFDDVREALETLTRPKTGTPRPDAVGYVLRRYVGRVRGGLRLVRTETRNKVQAWGVEQVSAC